MTHSPQMSTLRVLGIVLLCLLAVGVALVIGCTVSDLAHQASHG